MMHLTERVLARVGLALLLLLVVQVDASLAQVATIAFPDTAVGSSSAVQCPTTSVSLCFGASCSGTGTIQGVNGPTAPFSLGQFNLLTTAQFFAGNCTANPVGFPVTIGPGQVLAYRATFSPTTAGSFSGAATFSTSGGPATVSLTGTATGSSPPPGPGQGLITMAVDAGNSVPGSALSLGYRTQPGTLQGPADIYLVVVTPIDQILFFTGAGITPGVGPFQANTTITDTTVTVFSSFLPVNIPFGVYTFYMLLVRAGADVANSQNWVSPLASASFAFGPLSAVQRSTLADRGRNPDLLAVTWLPELNQKQETWTYLSGDPTRFVFVNGGLTSQDPVSPPAGATGPGVDPAQFTPQTTVETLTAAFGPPTTVATLDDAGEFQQVSFALGLDVVLHNGRLSSAVTSQP